MFSLTNFTGAPDHRRGLAYFNLRWTLRLHRQHLNDIFWMARNLGQNLAELLKESYDPKSSWVTVGDMNMGPGALFAAAVETVDGARASYGGLIAVELRTITKRFKDEFQPDEAVWAAQPTLSFGHSIFASIRAISNNFRHYDDWKTTFPLTREQQRDIRVIAALRKMQYVIKANWNIAFGTNMAWHCLKTLGDTYGDIEQLVIEGAEALLTASRVPTSPGIAAARSF